MLTLKNDKALYVDVDGTLVIWNGTIYYPNITCINYIKQFHARGQPVVVWSAGGTDWALKVVHELGLQDLVSAVLPKPAWWIDDLSPGEFMSEETRIKVI